MERGSNLQPFGKCSDSQLLFAIGAGVDTHLRSVGFEQATIPLRMWDELEEGAFTRNL